MYCINCIVLQHKKNTKTCSSVEHRVHKFSQYYDPAGHIIDNFMTNPSKLFIVSVVDYSQ